MLNTFKIMFILLILLNKNQFCIFLQNNWCKYIKQEVIQYVEYGIKS